jgi:hypothetical protein
MLVEEHKVEEFLSGRSARFARKLTRHSTLELQALVNECCNDSKDYKYQHHCNAGGPFKGGEEDVSDGGRGRHNGVLEATMAMGTANLTPLPLPNRDTYLPFIQGFLFLDSCVM